MGSLLHLHDAHERAQMLIPWRVNGTLDEAEAVLLDAHLADCAECRADLAAETTLRRELASMPSGVRLEQVPRVPAGPARPRLRAPGRRRFVARPIPLGWAVAGQAAAAAAVALFFMLPQASPVRDPAYRLLGADEARPAGNVIVMFDPETRENDLRTALEQAGARIVDGPTASGAYLVRVAPAERPAALQRLRDMSQVTLAEPVDPDAAQ